MVRMRVHLLDLPYDIFAIIFNQLDPKSFLSLCSSCYELYEHVSDLDFWRRETQNTFRLPNRPSAQYDGNRWKSLYRRLLKETQIYLWGQQRRTRSLLKGQKDHAHLNIFQYPSSKHPFSNGVIVDMQIGGWSTTVLDSTGLLYTSGTMFMNFMRDELGSDAFVPLKFLTSNHTELPAVPEGRIFRHPHTRPRTLPNPGPISGGAVTPEDPHTISIPVPDGGSPEELDQSSRTIEKFSAGRGHVIALADNGTVWLWYRVSQPALELKFQGVGDAKIDWVCGGFTHSSAYIRNWGIVVWKYSDKYVDLVNDPPQPWEIPTSGDWSMLVEKSVGDSDIGRVIKHILLEHYVLFITDRGRLFCSNILGPPTFEIPEISNAIDLQGSFRSFGVFKKDGCIIVASQDLLTLCEQRATVRHFEDEISLPVPIPALQNSGVVQLAFGDYHFHALHSDGRITSYGNEPSGCGALGLSGIAGRNSTKIRGARNTFADIILLPHCYFTGRSVWFSKAKHKWQLALTAVFTDNPIDDESKLGEFSEWVEQRGSDWDDLPDVKKLNHDGLGSHFALSIAAGGWSSGALLLVNEEMDKEIEKLCPPPPWDKLPNIRFSDGSYSMPGGELYEWKNPPPVFNIEPGDGEIWGRRGWVWKDEHHGGNEN